LINTIEINERLIEHNCVLGLSIDIEPRTLKYNLMMTLGTSEESNCGKLHVYFYDISNFNLVDFGGGLTQFMHLKIDTDDSGMDRAYFKITEEEHDNVSFHFSSCDVLD
jgi:hypothetical protein